MKHVQDHIAAWLADELEPGLRAAVESHLASCAACAAAAAESRAIWDMVAPSAAEAAVAASAEMRPTVWPAVRARTVEAGRGGLLYGGGTWSKAGVAVAALAAGLVLAILVPAPGGSQAGAETVAAGSFWVDQDVDSGFSGLWLAVADEEDPS